MKTILGKPHKQSGQATLETVLMLVIGMMIALGLVYRFNTAFKKYTIDMYGTYYRCLLETGELPGVGSVCRDKSARFAIANGKTLVNSSGSSGGGDSGSGGSGSGQGGGGSGSGGSSNGGSTDKGGSTSKNGSGSSEGGGGGSDSPSEQVGNSSGSGGRGPSVIGRLRGLQKPRSTSVGMASADQQNGAESAVATPALDANRSRGSSDNLRGARTKMNFEMEGAGYARSGSAGVTAIPATAKAASKKGDRGDTLRPRKVEEKPQSVSTARLKDENGGGLEFGKIFRLFIIFGIIVAIVIFLGGQVLQISKGGEK